MNELACPANSLLNQLQKQGIQKGSKVMPWSDVDHSARTIWFYPSHGTPFSLKGCGEENVDRRRIMIRDIEFINNGEWWNAFRDGMARVVNLNNEFLDGGMSDKASTDHLCEVLIECDRS